MPRPGPRRPNVNVRLSPDGLAAIDKFAAEATEATGVKVTRSDMIRTLLREAVTARQKRAAR